MVQTLTRRRWLICTETQHLGRSEEVFSRRGTFSWDEQGRTITLQGIDPAIETNHYLVGEDRLFKVDEDGNPMLNAHLLERSRRGMEGR